MSRSGTTKPTRVLARPRVALVAAGAVVALVGSGCSGSGSPTASNGPSAGRRLPVGPACVPTEDRNGCLKVAPADARVDLTAPTFSDPTSISNALHPSSKIAQVIYGGQVGGKPFRTEFTLLPGVRTIAWNGQQIKTITWQYLSYSDGRIEEIALDWFAQADDGSVWYLGEDVSDYKDGVVFTHEGTWLAGKDGPGAMIMPSDPQVGDVYRTENAPGIVFEEITVRSVDQTLPGPYGPVTGAMVVSELHTDGTREDKTFAPGYGEFSTGNPGGDLEAVSLAAPTDVTPGSPPADLVAFSKAVRASYDAAAANDWAAAGRSVDEVETTWDAYREGGVPDILDKQVTRDIDFLVEAVRARRGPDAHQAALRVAQDDTDLALRYRSVVEVDLTRLDLWTRQLRVDVADQEAGSVAGDVATLGLIRDRVRHTLDPAAASDLEAALSGLQVAADAQDLAAAAASAAALDSVVAGIQPRT